MGIERVRIELEILVFSMHSLCIYADTLIVSSEWSGSTNLIQSIWCQFLFEWISRNLAAFYFNYSFINYVIKYYSCTWKSDAIMTSLDGYASFVVVWSQLTFIKTQYLFVNGCVSFHGVVGVAVGQAFGILFHRFNAQTGKQTDVPLYRCTLAPLYPCTPF